MSIRTHLATLAVCSAVALAGDRMRDWGYAGHGYNWSGLYFGGSLGEAWGDSSFVFANGNPADPNPIDHDGSLTPVGQFLFRDRRQRSRNGPERDINLSQPSLLMFGRGRRIWMIGPRLGYVANNWQFYGTGGYAVGSIDTQTTTIATGVQFDTGSERHGGWYLGGRVEWGITRNVSLGIEYKHIELDDELHVSSSSIPTENRFVNARLLMSFRLD